MTVRPIRITGDPVLHHRAQPVSDFGPALDSLICDMVDTMRAAPGVGLAAPQIGVGLQVFVWEWEDQDGVLHEGTVINPSLHKSALSRGRLDEEADAEGCLSIPDLRFATRRAPSVTLRGSAPSGDSLEITAEGWLARIFQHEWDHLQGILYTDRLSLRRRRHAKSEIAAHDWGTPGLSWQPGLDDYEGSGKDAEEAEPRGNNPS